MPELADEPLMTAPEVEEYIGVHRSTIRRWELKGVFPKRVYIGPNKVAWVEREVREWRARQIANRERGFATS